MSDPFGDDELDFDTEKFLRTAYNSAIHLLRERRPINQTQVPLELINPLVVAAPTMWSAGSGEGGQFGSGTGGGFLTGGSNRGGWSRREEPTKVVERHDAARLSLQWEA